MSTHRRLLSFVILLTALVALLPASPAQASGDDYPYRADTSQTSDPWWFTKRQCTSFVAWRLKQHSRPINNATQHWGNADHWDDTARARGVVISSRPKVGATAQWNRYERTAYYSATSSTPNGTFSAGAYGHVGYVMAVYPDGSIRLEGYNLFGNRAYSQVRVKAPRYLYMRG